MNQEESAIEFIFDRTIPFSQRCQDVFRYQLQQNPIYQKYAEVFGLNPHHNPEPKRIPLLPIRAFKEGHLTTQPEKDAELLFKSSGTSEMVRSTHHVVSKRIYERAIIEEFVTYFPFEEYTVLFHLPGYDKNPYSSLIWMAQYLVKKDPSNRSRFVNGKELTKTDISLVDRSDKILLFGAAFGLLDLIESGSNPSISNLEILETGGMKTHRREMSKTQLRLALAEGFNVELANIHSEYGMCELLSQCYAIGHEWFTSPHWVDVTIRDPKNPSRVCEPGKEGLIGIIDLANIYSCPFILTDDKGVMDESGKFKVLGRWDADDLRGCNFLIDHE